MKWTGAEAEGSANRALAALTALATSVAERRQICRDSTMAAEVRRRDAQQWSRDQDAGGEQDPGGER